MEEIKIAEVCICKHFHIFYMTDKTKMCDLYGECKIFTGNKSVNSCKSFDNNKFNKQEDNI